MDAVSPSYVCSDDMQPHEADGIHQDRPVKARFAARHVDAGGIAPRMGVPAAAPLHGSRRRKYRSSPRIRLRHGHRAVLFCYHRRNAAAHAAACIFDEQKYSGCRPQWLEHVKINRKTAFSVTVVPANFTAVSPKWNSMPCFSRKSLTIAEPVHRGCRGTQSARSTTVMVSRAL